jgi:hypothetical protein
MWHMKLNRTRSGLYLVVIARAGLRPGVLLIEFIEEWQRAVTAAGKPITIEEFIRWTKRYSRRTTFTRVAQFRKTFPQLGPGGLPHGLMGPLLDRLAAELEPDE